MFLYQALSVSALSLIVCVGVLGSCERNSLNDITCVRFIECFYNNPFATCDIAVLNDDTNQDSQFWSKSIKTPTVSVWKGLAFERLCLQHIDQIKKALGISGVLTKVYSWRHQPNEIYPQGAQIDLLIERADRVVNICEMKWCDGAFAIDKETDTNLRTKVATFRSVTGCKLSIHLTLVTPEGILHNKYWNTIQSEVTLAELFT